MDSIVPPSTDSKLEPPALCDDYCMAPFGHHHERCQFPTDHDGGRIGCNHAGGFCSDRPSNLGSR